MRRLWLVTLLAGLWLVLTAGTLAAQSSGIPDGGPSEHAQGTINGDVYTVVWGDTIFSIARRFGVGEQALMDRNNIRSPYRLLAGTRIIIPGRGPGPVLCPTPSLSITNPAPGSRVGVTFNVGGSGCGLPAGTLVVRVLDSRGVEVSRVTTSLIGPDVGAGGQGAFNTTLTAPGAQGPTLTLLASSGNVQASPVVVNVEGPGMCASPLLSIFDPAEGAGVPASFTVRGEAGFNCTVTLTARDPGGRQLGVANATTFQGTTWATTLALQGGIAPGTEVIIDASTNGGGATARRVRFGSIAPATLSITTPPPNTALPAIFEVSGFGSGLVDGIVVVRAISDSQGVLAGLTTSVGAGGQGSFNVALTVNTVTRGHIEAFNPATGVRTSVPVTFNGGSSGATFRNLAEGQCWLMPNSNAPAFTNPDGTQVRTLSSNWLSTRRVVRFGGQLWYVIPGADASALDEGVRAAAVSLSGDCGL